MLVGLFLNDEQKAKDFILSIKKRVDLNFIHPSQKKYACTWHIRKLSQKKRVKL